MSELRDRVETAGAPMLSIHKRVDALLLAVGDLYDKVSAITEILGDDGTDLDALSALFVVLGDDEHGRGIREARERMQARSPEALEKFIRERREATAREPFVSTDNSPRRRRRRVGGQLVPDSASIIDKWGQPVEIKE